MTCREFSDFIMDYLGGDLSDEAKAKFERHLSRCPHCPEYLRQYEDGIKAGKAAFRDLESDASTKVPEELIEAILATRRTD